MESDKRSRNWVDPSVYLSVRDADLLEDVMVLQRDMIAIHPPLMREPPAVHSFLWSGGARFSTFDYLGTHSSHKVRYTRTVIMMHVHAEARWQ